MMIAAGEFRDETQLGMFFNSLPHYRSYSANVYRKKMNFRAPRPVYMLHFQTLAVQVKCFHEIISIGYQVYRIHGLPW